MSVPVDLDELLAAYEWASAGDAVTADAEAFISRTGSRID